MRIYWRKSRGVIKSVMEGVGGGRRKRVGRVKGYGGIKLTGKQHRVNWEE